MKISILEQQIYNTHLKFSRKGQAWTPRKDFSDLSEENLIILFKLKNFFSKFKHINLDNFFEAPIVLHPEENYPPLKFFCTRKAIKNYKLVLQQKENESPEKQLDSIKNGLYFISKFCLEKNIEWDQYLSYKEEYMPLWIQHYKEQQINIYSIIASGNHHLISSIPQEDLDIWLPDFLNKFYTYKNRLHHCFHVKEKLTKVVNSLKIFISTKG